MGQIDIEHLSFSYTKGKPVIKDLSLSIEKGEFVGIIGHNGSGKSTLAKLLAGLEEAKQGTIKIDGDILNEENYPKLNGKIGIIFQNPDNQFVGATVRDDIAFGLENRSIERERMKEIIEQYASLVSMTKYLDTNPENLSGGEKQRVAIAGVLALDAEIIILDEATSMLDPIGQREVNALIRTLRGKKTIIFITHMVKEVADCDHLVVLSKGEKVLEGSPEEVFKEERILEECRLSTLPALELRNMLKECGGNIARKEELEAALWDIAFKR